MQHRLLRSLVEIFFFQLTAPFIFFTLARRRQNPTTVWCSLKICNNNKAFAPVCSHASLCVSLLAGQWRRDDRAAAQHYHFLCADRSEARGGVHRQPGGPQGPGEEPARHRHFHNVYVLAESLQLKTSRLRWKNNQPFIIYKWKCIHLCDQLEAGSEELTWLKFLNRRNNVFFINRFACVW